MLVENSQGATAPDTSAEHNNIGNGLSLFSRCVSTHMDYHCHHAVGSTEMTARLRDDPGSIGLDSC